MTDSSSVRNRGEGAELALLYPLTYSRLRVLVAAQVNT